MRNNSIPVRVLKHSGRDLEEQINNGGTDESGTQNETETKETHKKEE